MGFGDFENFKCLSLKTSEYWAPQKPCFWQKGGIYISVGWQAHRGEPAKTSVAKTGDAPSRLRTSQLTPLNLPNNIKLAQQINLRISRKSNLASYIPYNVSKMSKIGIFGYLETHVPNGLQTWKLFWYNMAWMWGSTKIFKFLRYMVFEKS